MKLWILTSITGVVLVLIIAEMLRRRKLKEKYAALWMVTGVAIIPLGFFPSGLDSVAQKVGVRSGVSLILFLSVVFLFMVCLQLSWEVGRLEEETRTLAEEIALIRGTSGQGRVVPEPPGYAGQRDGRSAVTAGLGTAPSSTTAGESGVAS